MFGDYPNLKVTPEETILVEDSAYLKKFAEKYAEMIKDPEKIKDLDNLMIWTLVKQSTEYLPKVYREIKLGFDKYLYGTSSLQPRSKICTDSVLQYMPFAIGRIYVEKNFDENSKKAVILQN